MSLLITGAYGQVGRELVAQAGTHAVGIDRDVLDLGELGAVLSTLRRLRPRVVINAAAYTAVDKAEQEPGEAFAANRDGVAHLATACSELRIPLLHVSTDYVYDGRKAMPYNEEDEPNPQGVYARSKLEGDQRLRELLDQHLILRVSWVFSAHGNNFVKTILRLAATRPALRVVADQHGGPTPAADIARALLLLARRYETDGPLPWGTYHYSGAPATSWHGFASAIVTRAAQLGMIAAAPEVAAITTAEYPLPAPRPANSVFDCSRAAKLLGLKQPEWRQGLDDVLRVLKAAT